MKWTILSGSRFPKDLAALPSRYRRRIADFAFTTLPSLEDPFAAAKIEKLKGYTGFYKIRFGVYRLGLFIDIAKKQIQLLRVLHRKDIYRQFP